MLRISNKFIFLLTAMALFMTQAWGSSSDATNVEDQALTFFRNHEVAGTCVWIECLEDQPVLARGGGSGGGYGNDGSFGKGSPGTNASEQHQYQHRKTDKRQNQYQHKDQYQHREKSGTQNQHQHKDQYQHREESGAQN